MTSQKARVPPEVFDREERVRRFGVDCGDELLWEDGTWTPGGEFVKTLVLKNVGNETIKIKYRPPETSFFSMDFPEVIALSPGMSFPVQVIFRPVRIEPYDDYIEFVIRNKKLKWTFYIPVKARLSNVSISVPEMLDFGFCPISETSVRSFEVRNTGQVTVEYEWEMQPPFQIEPSKGTIEDVQTFETTYAPIDASVVVSKALLHVSGLETSPVVFKLSGIGKYPHVSLSETRVDFGEVLPGASTDKEIMLRNQSFVPAKFSIRRVENDLPPVFDVRPGTGVVEPGQMTPLRVRYQPTALGQFSCDSYLIETPGGNVAQLDLVGLCVGPEVSAGETRVVQFGECVMKAGPSSAPTRALHLRNNAEKPVRYHFFADPHSEFEFVDPAIGEIPAKLEKAITVRFRASRPGNYYRRLFCVLQDQLPLYFDLLGTCYDDSIEGRSNRPQPLLARHIVAHRERELLGLERETPEHLLEVEHDRALRGETERASHANVFPEDDVSVACSGGISKGQLEVCEQLFKRPTQASNVVVLDADELDFGGSSSLRANADKRVLRVTNYHHAKITCGWTVNWPSQPQGADETGSKDAVQAPFAIFPDTQDISPGRTVEFRVHFRPNVDNAYFFATATAYAHLKSNRTFRLVKDKAFIPPWFLSVRLLGHTFQPGVEHFLPKVRFIAPERTDLGSETGSQVSSSKHAFDTTEAKGEYWHPIQFPVCHLGESALQTIVIENNGDTPVRFEFSNDPSECFDVMPRSGQIERGAFQIVALKCTPASVGERKFQLKCRLNGAASNTHTLALSSFCAVPTIQVAEAQDISGTDGASLEALFIKPTCLGLRSQRQVSVRNRSRVPLEFEWRVPKRFRSVLSVEPSRGLLRGNERTLVTWDFAPRALRAYEMDCVLFSRSIWPRPGIATESRSILSIHGSGSTSCVAFTEMQVDLGTVLAQASSIRDIGITNHADCEVAVKFDILGDRADYLAVSPNSLTVPARATLPVRLSFTPQKCGNFDFKVVCTCLDQGKDSGSGATCAASGAAADPSVVFEDARATASPAALWKQLDLGRLNTILSSPVTDEEVEFAQCATVPGMGRSRKDELREQLDTVCFRFTPAPHMSPTEHIHLQLRNYGKLPAEFSVQFPNDADIDIEPWADSRDPCEAEMRQAFLLDQRVFEIVPRSALLGPGEAVTVRVSYRHHVAEYEGLHRLEVLFGLTHGKQVRVKLEGQTLSGATPFAFPVARRCELSRTPIGLRDPLVQFVEIRNMGAVDARYTVDAAPLQQLLQANYGFPVLKCLTLTGTISGAGGTARLEFIFAPLEDKVYKCKLPITVESALPQDAGEASIIEIELEARGFHPDHPETECAIEPKGASSPEQQALALPGQLASTSLDVLDFGALSVSTQTTRVVFLRNHTANNIFFIWDELHPLVTSGVASMVPHRGEIAPGEFCICKLTVSASDEAKPSVLDTDFACLITSSRDVPSRESGAVTRLGTSDPLGTSFRSESRASSVRRDTRKKRQPVDHESVVGRSTAARDLRMKALGRAPPSDHALILDDDLDGLPADSSLADVRKGTAMQSPRSPGGPMSSQRIYVRIRGKIYSERDATTQGISSHLYMPPLPSNLAPQSMLGAEETSRPSTRQSTYSLSSSSSSSSCGRSRGTLSSEATRAQLPIAPEMAQANLRSAAFHPSVQAAIEAQHEALPPRFVDMLAAEGLRAKDTPVHALGTQQDALERRRIDALLKPECQELTHVVLESTLVNLIEEASRGEISLIAHKTMLFREESSEAVSPQ
ncbi:Cilia- and flagella-associated protein 65 [Hondaea fermentalgiana]|uniref:Cilia-and flagella-associated protein 65 n=1 Tax=Hondaea fermentalgiana TaxID=2315210 RepID=A0A2R5G0V0_9STRA|nr:Cilia- and flagella-associated protein 65 [Hondaea fermentalgiana]|eukprot:GBG24646.1 Cilia- and flagella-associated protein 65 [Hondaea fermentalgiana]